MGPVKLVLISLSNFGIITTIFFITSTPLRANDIRLAEIFVENLGSKIIKLVDSESSISAKRQKLLGLFQNNASVLTISRAALGSKWRTLDSKSRIEFSNAFTSYLVRKYGKQFEEFQGARLVLERSIDAGKRGVLVNTRLIMPGSSPISIKWQVWWRTDTFKLIDIIIEDISMLTMEREEIKNRLSINRGIIESLIEDLKGP